MVKLNGLTRQILLLILLSSFFFLIFFNCFNRDGSPSTEVDIEEGDEKPPEYRCEYCYGCLLCDRGHAWYSLHGKGLSYLWYSSHCKNREDILEIKKVAFLQLADNGSLYRISFE